MGEVYGFHIQRFGVENNFLMFLKELCHLSDPELLHIYCIYFHQNCSLLN